MKNHQNEVQSCIDVCQECHDVCQETLFGHCLQMGGEHVGKEHVKLMMDCIELCQAAANFMRRDSQFHAYVCAACAEICEACAESCAEVGGRRMKECADVCYLCAEKCREMGVMRSAA
ncbi:MAG: four-helix bundle copper-binding protein [Proteobacteria bacterium]|nr:four-helix bundle copper-binding protein [Pseudomonadota bacterium]